MYEKQNKLRNLYSILHSAGYGKTQTRYSQIQSVRKGQIIEGNMANGTKITTFGPMINSSNMLLTKQMQGGSNNIRNALNRVNQVEQPRN